MYLSVSSRALKIPNIPTAIIPDPKELDGFAALPAAEHYINHNIKIVPETLQNWDDEIFEDIRPSIRPNNGKSFCPSDKWLGGEIEALFVTFGEEKGNFRCLRVNLKFKTGKLHFNFSNRPVNQKLDGCTLSWIADLTHEPVQDFVKGHGLTQKLKEIPPKDRKWAENVPYFIPRQFDLTMTKGDGEYSNGVINYYLLTHRPDEDPNRSVGEGFRSIEYEKDVGAGFWDAGNTPYKRIRAHRKASGAGGVMTFSREIFRDYWLSENFLSYFKPTATYNEHISKGCQDQVNKLCLTQKYKFQPMTCQDMDTDKMKESEDLSAFLNLVLRASKKINMELKYLQRRQVQGRILYGSKQFDMLANSLPGFAEAILTYTSDVQKNPHLGKSADTNRKIYFDVAMPSLLSIKQEASGICNINRLFEDKKRVAMWTLTAGIGLAADMIANPQWFIDIFTQWLAPRRANIQIVTKVGFDMSPAGDTWSLALEKDRSRTTVPIGSEELPKQVNPPVSFTTLENIIGEQKMTDLSRRIKGYGVIIDLENHDMFKEFGTSKGMDRFAKPANQWASNFESRLESNMAALASSLMTKLILPAGNVFEFKSLSL
ncbi:hypothetical protein NCS52_01523500 [Fusarium sp. LHS14.1]|nr:hypothetical protein NCS52_01523500 [Fusarium sp. LHS14.1]